MGRKRERAGSVVNMPVFVHELSWSDVFFDFDLRLMECVCSVTFSRS